jgi:hypothetical protein
LKPPALLFSGYWFEIVDPSPTDRAYTDECDIGTSMTPTTSFDPLHPGIRLVVGINSQKLFAKAATLALTIKSDE